MEKQFECKTVGVEFFESAPFVFKAQEEIAATPEEIFAAFEDAHSWTVWAMPIQNVEWTSPQPFGLGTTRTVSMSGGLIGWETFIAWERGKRMAFCFTHISQDNMESFAEDYQVEELGDGKCRVTWQMAMAPKGVSRYFLPVFSPIMGWAVKRMFRNFKRHVEADFAGTTAAP